MCWAVGPAPSPGPKPPGVVNLLFKSLVEGPPGAPILKVRPQIRSFSTTWELVREADSQFPPRSAESEETLGWSPGLCVSTGPPGDSNAHCFESCCPVAGSREVKTRTPRSWVKVAGRVDSLGEQRAEEALLPGSPSAWAQGTALTSHRGGVCLAEPV